MESYYNPFPIAPQYKGLENRGFVTPFKFKTHFNLPYLYRVVFDDKYFGDVKWDYGEWICEGKDGQFVERIGEYIMIWYQ